MRMLGSTSLIVAVTIAVMTSTVLAGTAFAGGDPSRGKKVAKKCTACHTMKKGGKNRLGPNLFVIVDKPAASVEGYRYSKALTKSGIDWNDAALDAYLTKPKKFVKGTKMSFAGIKKAKQRADLIAYLRTLK